MKVAEFYNFTLPPDAWNKKPHLSRWKMTMEEAAARYPGAVPDLLSKEVRRLPETDEERIDMNTSLHTKIDNRWPGG